MEEILFTMSQYQCFYVLSERKEVLLQCVASAEQFRSWFLERVYQVKKWKKSCSRATKRNISVMFTHCHSRPNQQRSKFTDAENAANEPFPITRKKETSVFIEGMFFLLQQLCAGSQVCFELFWGYWISHSLLREDSTSGGAIRANKCQLFHDGGSAAKV